MKDIKAQIISILYSHSNPYGYQLVGEDSFDNVADDIINFLKSNDTKRCKKKH